MLRNVNIATSDIQSSHLTHLQRGYAFILGNRVSSSAPYTHERSVRLMEQLWKYEIGCQQFDGTSHTNINRNQMKSLFKRLAKMESDEFDYLVVVIVARGGLMESRSGLGECPPRSRIRRAWRWFSNRLPTNRTYSQFFLGNDGKKLSEDKVISYFYNDSSTWKDKPKLFILAYDRVSKMVINESSTVLVDRQEQRRELNTARNFESTQIGTTNMPTICDFILVHGTSSCLVDAIYSVFSGYWRSKSVIELLTSVNHEMKCSGNGTRPMSVFESSLGRSFSLRPEQDIPDQDAITPQPEIPPVIQEMINLATSEEYRKNTFLLGYRFLALLRENQNQLPLTDRQSDPTIVPRASKGCALVLCNILEPGSSYHEQDGRNMRQLWKVTLGCDLYGTEPQMNKSAEQMKDLLREFSAIDASLYEYAVVVISGHGGMNKIRFQRRSRPAAFQPNVSCPIILGTDNKSVDEREILSYFNRDDSPWRGKVKIFILDYCRGYHTDFGVPRALAFAEPFAEDEVTYEIDEIIHPPTISALIEDSFLVYATHVGYVAYTDRLITSIKEEFISNWKEKSVAEMLTSVNGRMKTSPRCPKTMSVFKSTVTKDFFLFQ